jgi:hypothetical protein
METKGAEVFSMALEKNKTLTSLSLAGNELTHMGGRYISDSLLRNPSNSLVYIDLRHNQIGNTLSLRPFPSFLISIFLHVACHAM